MDSITPTDRLIFPLDVPTAEEALEMARLLKGHVGVFKVGLELFTCCGPGVVVTVAEETGAGIFLDLKLHDIPATVAGAVRSASALGVEFATVHCSGGSAMLRAAADAAEGVKVLGVTVLTSLNHEDLVELGVDMARFGSPLELAVHLARMAREAGCAGVVCSGREAGAVREALGPDLLIVTPGIRDAADAVCDQKRVVTPYAAIMSGADYIVVGRPIREAPDPAGAADSIAGRIEEALKEREEKT